MSKKISIAIDAMGGDNAPDKTIEGIKIFLDKNKSKNDFTLNIFGQQDILDQKIKKYNLNLNLINVINSNTVVSDEESPITAVKNSKNTSMWNCIKHQLDGKSDISISAGNTGVLLVISRMILKMMNEVSKPALAGLWPNQKGVNVVLDLGANIECNDDNLVDFAELGSALFKSLFPDEKPKVSLLNIGSEEIKGTDILKSASKKLRDLSSEDNFIYNGYIEGNHIMSGDSNVIVTDGFTGIIALKTAEGTANLIKKFFMDEFSLSLSGLFMGFLMKKKLRRLKERMDPRTLNGGVFVGLNGLVIKSHGSSDSKSFYSALKLAKNMSKTNSVEYSTKNLS